MVESHSDILIMRRKTSKTAAGHKNRLYTERAAILSLFRRKEVRTSFKYKSPFNIIAHNPQSLFTLRCFESLKARA